MPGKDRAGAMEMARILAHLPFAPWKTTMRAAHTRRRNTTRSLPHAAPLPQRGEGNKRGGRQPAEDAPRARMTEEPAAERKPGNDIVQ